jgi:hypothetical protein
MGQTRDLPASAAIPLHVMWPRTPAERQPPCIAVPHILPSRANKDSRPLRYLTFRVLHETMAPREVRSRSDRLKRRPRYA